MGWARANLYYDKGASLPTPGSLREVVCLLVQRYRQHQALCALVVQVAAPEKKKDALREYQDALAPYAARARQDETARAAELLSNMGPLFIVPEEKR